MMNRFSYPRTITFLTILWLVCLVGGLIVNPAFFIRILEKELLIVNILSIFAFLIGIIEYWRNMDIIKNTSLIQYNKTSLIWFLSSTVILIALMLVRSIF